MADNKIKLEDLTKLDEMLTVKPSGMPVKERITSIQAARAIYDKIKQDAAPEEYRRARLKGMIDGNPPYDSNRLRELGAGHRTNVNFLEARAILDMKASAWYELFFEVPTLIEAQLRVNPNPQQPKPPWGGVVAEEFTKTLFAWSGFLVGMDTARRQADAFGLGVMLWRDEWDWRPKAFQRASFIPDSMAELDLENLPFFCMRDHVTAGDLYRWALENEEISKDEGWIPAAVKRLLVRVYIKGEGSNSTDPFQTSEWEGLQQRIRNNDWTVQQKEFEQVKIIHMCVREVESGAVSHYIFPEKPDPGNDEFLYRKAGRFLNVSNVLWWLPFNNGDGYIRSCRGLASMIQPHCDLSNRFLSQVFDAGFLTGSLLVQPASAMDLSQLQLIRMGAVTVLPPGLSAIQQSFTPKLGELVQLRDLSSSIMRNNTGVFRTYGEMFAERQPEKTARQVVEEVSRENRMEKSNVTYDYYHIERLYREIFRRMTNQDYILSKTPYPGQAEARDFVMRCQARGVPAQVLLNYQAWEIYATRAVGMGSLGVKMDITNQILQARGMLDEEGQTNALRDWLAVRVGYQNIDRYRTQKNRDQIPTNETSIAVLENNDMMEGGSVPVGSDQLHTMHFTAHSAVLTQIIEAVQQGGEGQVDAMKMLQLLSVTIPHCQQHLQYLSQDPTRKEFVDNGVALLKQAQSIYQKMQKVAARMAEEQAKMQQQQQETVAKAEQVLRDRELEAKVMEIQGKLELENRKQESLNQMRADKTAAQMDIQRQRVQHDMELQAQRQASELQMNALKTDADIEMKKLKAREQSAATRLEATGV